MNCTPEALLQAAACYQCAPKHVVRSSMIYLLCEWSNHLSQPFSYEPETELIQWTDSGGVHTGDLSTFRTITAVTGQDTVTDLDATFGGGTITSFTNLSALSGLVNLFVNGTFITALDLTGCISLQTLIANDCGDLTAVTGLTTCTPLTTVRLQNCNLTGGLDVSGLINISVLWCYSNPLLTSITLTGCTGLSDLKCDTCGLLDLDCSGLNSLATLYCNSNASLTTLTLTGCTGLVTLDCNTCNISPAIIGISSCTSLVTLIVHDNNNLSSLSITGLTDLQFVDCETCNITGAFSASGLVNLVHLNCSDNILITTVNTTNCSALKELLCSICGISTLDLTTNTNLTLCNCHTNSIGNLNLSFNTLLEEFYSDNNLMTSLDVSASNVMSSLTCQFNALTSVSIGNSTAYIDVELDGNLLPAGPNGVDSVLNKLATNCLANAGSCRLNEPATNSSPTGGILNADYIALVGAGWTPVLIN